MQAREPQGPIQANPDGLLGLFQIKGQAINPNSLQGFIQGVIDTTEFFIAGRARRLAVGANVVGASSGIGQSFTTPVVASVGEVLYFRRGGIYFNVPPGEQLLQLGLCMFQVGSPTEIVPLVSVQGDFTAGALGLAISVSLPGALVLPGGWQLGCDLCYEGATPTSIVGAFEFVRLPA